LVMRHGQTFRIPTLVPARRSDGACIFLTETAKCSIHPVSPYGCAYFDSHMSHAEADCRSLRGLQAVAEAWRAGDVYARLWTALSPSGVVAESLELARQHLRLACNANRSL